MTADLVIKSEQEHAQTGNIAMRALYIKFMKVIYFCRTTVLLSDISFNKGQTRPGSVDSGDLGLRESFNSNVLASKAANGIGAYFHVFPPSRECPERPIRNQPGGVGR